MGIFVKSAVLRAEVFIIPTKNEGLRMQSSEVHIGAPGVGNRLTNEYVNTEYIEY